jgi:uncharacterized membrane protein YfcA
VNGSRIGLLLAAGFAAGLMNAIAGGGTIVTFPALIFAGISSISANATSTVALLPGTLAGVAGYRRVLPAVWKWIRSLVAVSVIGGLIGGILLTKTPVQIFDRLVPFLILFATLLFTARTLFTTILHLEAKQPTSRRWLIAGIIFQLFVSIYGGYFGAGIGILMLASLGVFGFENIHEMNAVKNVLAFLINAVAAGYFIFKGLIDWPAAAIVAIGAIAGGYSGAHFSQKVPEKAVRFSVSAIGLAVTAIMFYKQLGAK